MKKERSYILLKSIFGISTLLFLGVSAYLRTGLKKEEFQKITGRITYLEKAFQQFPTRDIGKYRYIRLDNYPEVFEIFIGKDRGDFKPDFEKIDSLKVGDEITVYQDDEGIQRRSVNSIVSFIDRGNEAMFIRGDWRRTGAYIAIGGSLVIFLLVCMVEWKEKLQRRSYKD